MSAPPRFFYRVLTGPAPEGEDSSWDLEVRGVLEGPTPVEEEEFRSFVNQLWAAAQEQGDSHMLLGRVIGGRGAEASSLHSAARPPGALGAGSTCSTEVDSSPLEGVAPVFSCLRDKDVHISITYWGRPEGEPKVRVTPLRQQGQASSIEIELGERKDN